MSQAPRVGLFAVLHASGVLESRTELKLAEVGLSLPKLAALHRLADAGGSLPLGQLAERLACVKSNVTQLVDRLEADGLVTRTADAGDKRSRLAVITEAGRHIHHDGARIQREVEDELFATLSVDDSVRLAEIIAKLKKVSR